MHTGLNLYTKFAWLCSFVHMDTYCWGIRTTKPSPSYICNPRQHFISVSRLNHKTCAALTTVSQMPRSTNARQRDHHIESVINGRSVCMTHMGEQWHQHLNLKFGTDSANAPQCTLLPRQWSQNRMFSVCLFYSHVGWIVEILYFLAKPINSNKDSIYFL
jgi:hypothetical protein